MYLAAVIDWYSRYVIAWRLSNTLDGSFCLEMLEEALRAGQAGGLQHRPGGAVHGGGVHRAAGGGRGGGEHGRAGAVPGQRVRGAAVEEREDRPNNTRTLHTRCRGGYNRRSDRLPVGLARTGPLVPGSARFPRRIRTMPDTHPPSRPPAPEATPTARRRPAGTTCRPANGRNCSGSSAGCSPSDSPATTHAAGRWRMTGADHPPLPARSPTRSGPGTCDRLAVVYVRQSTPQQVAEQPRVGRPAVPAPPPGRRARLGRRPGPGHRRRPGVQRPVRREPARLPAAAGRGLARPRRHRLRPGDEPAGPVVQGLAPAAGAVRPVPGPARRRRRRLRPDATSTTGSCSG